MLTNKRTQKKIRRYKQFERIATFVSKGKFLYISLSLIVLLMLLLLLFFRGHLQEGITQIVDFTVFSAVVLEALLATFSLWIKNKLKNRSEDPIKLTDDYYTLAHIRYKNEIDNMVKFKKSDGDEVVFPVIHIAWLEQYELVIEDHPECEYQIPYEIFQYYEELFFSHSTSSIYNNINIRVNTWYQEDNRFHIVTGRTTYYNSLVTNRCLDYPLYEGITVRELLESGPLLRPLKYSKLSNHLGFNGFLEDSEGNICFIYRKDNVSIGKRTWGDSIGASLKTKYALESYEFTEKGLMKGILKEYEDELKIKPDELQMFSNGKIVKLVAAYRDLVEGGKPQLLVYARSTRKWTEIKEVFDIEVEKKKTKVKEKLSTTKRHLTNKEKLELLMAEDGDEMKWIPLADLEDAHFSESGMTCNGIYYPMVPSASASVIMFLQYMEKDHKIE